MATAVRPLVSCQLLDLLEVLVFVLSKQLVFLLVAMVDQCVHLLDHAAQLLLLSTQLVLQAIETDHHAIELPVFSLDLGLLAVEHAELVLELGLDLALRGTGLILLLAVDGDEVSQLGALLALTDLNDDAHHHILEAILTEGLSIRHCLHVLGQTHDVIARELALLLQDLVLIDEQITTKWLVFVLFNQLLDLLVAQEQKLGISHATEVDVHVVLHEESTVIDS